MTPTPDTNVQLHPEVSIPAKVIMGDDEEGMLVTLDLSIVGVPHLFRIDHVFPARTDDSKMTILLWVSRTTGQ